MDAYITVLLSGVSGAVVAGGVQSLTSWLNRKGERKRWEDEGARDADRRLWDERRLAYSEAIAKIDEMAHALHTAVGAVRMGSVSDADGALGVVASLLGDLLRVVARIQMIGTVDTAGAAGGIALQVAHVMEHLIREREEEVEPAVTDRELTILTNMLAELTDLARGDLGVAGKLHDECGQTPMVPVEVETDASESGEGDI